MMQGGRALAKQLLPDTLWAEIAPLIPADPERPQGGRPPVGARDALTGILFVLYRAIPWEHLPFEVADRTNLPLAFALTGANVHDSKALIKTVDALQPIRQRRGRPRKQPHKLHADEGYDYDRCRSDLRARGIVPRIARRGIEANTHLGKH
jgi:hypothetical protein